MRAYKSAVFALVAFTLGALPVGAQDATTVEVTPYVALGSAAASPVGAAVTFPVTSTLSVETDVAHRRGEGGIHALSSSTSLLYFLPRVGRSTPYAAAGVGLSQLRVNQLDRVPRTPCHSFRLHAGYAIEEPSIPKLISF